MIDWFTDWLVLNAVSAVSQPLSGGSLIDIGSNGSSLSDLSIASFFVVLHVSQLEGVLMHSLKFMSSDAVLQYEWGETMQMANFMLNIFTSVLEWNINRIRNKKFSYKCYITCQRNIWPQLKYKYIWIQSYNCLLKKKLVLTGKERRHLGNVDNKPRLSRRRILLWSISHKIKVVFHYCVSDNKLSLQVICGKTISLC